MSIAIFEQQPASFDFLPKELESIINTYKAQIEYEIWAQKIADKTHEFAADFSMELSRKIDIQPIGDDAYLTE